MDIMEVNQMLLHLVLSSRIHMAKKGLMELAFLHQRFQDALLY